jgi:hypothetical protein
MGLRHMIFTWITLYLAASAFAADAASTDANGVVTWAPATPGAHVTGDYKPTRWGMYDVEAQLESPAAGRVKLTLAGKELSGASDGSAASVKLGRMYVDKTDAQPVAIETEPADPAKPLVVKSLLLTPAPEGKPIVQSDDLSITLHARDATVHGVTLRYEVKPEKNTLGWWSNPKDWVSWDFDLKKPGQYIVVVMYGSGGGKDIEIGVANQTLNFTTKDTGGYHTFTFFEAGRVSFDTPGTQTLIVKPSVKTGGGVMDLRQVILLPVLK